VKVGLLVVGHVDEASRHVAGDYPELFGALLAPHGIDLTIYDLDVGRFPTHERECDGWICSPSRSSTYDDVGWIADAEDLLRAILQHERPYVGICFGHQLLAQALGTPVHRFDGGWQVGAHTYELESRPPWMDPAPGRIALIASHEDQVTAVPAGAALLARSVTGDCAVAGLTVGDRAWTLQGHPEFVPALADHLLERRVELIGAERVAAARATLAQPLDRLDVARWIARTVTG
jgi:GMP synthase-like glutamine amidotransferase